MALTSLTLPHENARQQRSALGVRKDGRHYQALVHGRDRVTENRRFLLSRQEAAGAGLTIPGVHPLEDGVAGRCHVSHFTYAMFIDGSLESIGCIKELSVDFEREGVVLGASGYSTCALEHPPRSRWSSRAGLPLVESLCSNQNATCRP